MTGIIIAIVATLVVAVPTSVLVTTSQKKKQDARDLESAENKSKRIIEEAKVEAERIKKEAMIEAKDEVIRQ